MVKDVLIFGGTYFVGYTIAKKLLKNGYNVTLLNRGTKDHKLPVSEIHVDRKNKAGLVEALADKDFDYVIDVSGINREDLSNAYEAVQHMNLKNYVFISSSAVYVPSEIQPISEEFRLGPNPFWGHYGTDKIEAENFLKAKYENEGFNFTVLRPPYIYGEGNYIYRESYVFDRIRNHKPVIIPKGNTLVQFLHAEELADIVISILDEKLAFGKTFNVGDPYGITFKGWVQKCMKAYGEKTEIIEFDNNAHGFNSRDFFPFYDYQYILDCSKIEKLCKPNITLDEGLKRACDWYKKNYEKIAKNPNIQTNEEKILKILGL